MNTNYSIPRYLGLTEKSRTHTDLEIETGYSSRLKKNVVMNLNESKILNDLIQNKVSKKNLSKIKPLIDAGIVKEEFSTKTPDNLKRYDRHLLFYQSYDLDPLETQKILSEKSVALLGMGGIGNWVSLNLIGAGLKELCLIDFDFVELSNLTRQVLFDEKDIGKSKVKTAAQKLKFRNTQTKVKHYEIKAAGVESLKRALIGVDFIIVSADRPVRIHDWVNSIAVKEKIPYLNIGYRDSEGVVGPLTIPGKTSCYQCFKPLNKISNTGLPKKIQNYKYQAPSFGPLNSYVSSIGALEMIKYFTKFGTCASKDTELAFDPVTLKISKTKYRKDPNCHCCKNLHV